MTTPLWLGQSEDHLVAIGEVHKLQPQVAASFLSMQQAAAQDQVDVQIVSSFRSFARQQVIWDQKWLGKRPLYSLTGELLDTGSLSEQEKLHAILTWSALPGASRHHWGTDLDVFDKAAVETTGHAFELVSEEYEPGGPCHALSCWLDEHAETYGFYRPYAQYNGGVAPEAWHLSYRPAAQDIIQQLDLDDLTDAIDASDIQGKPIILRYLPQIFRQYTLNGVS